MRTALWRTAEIARVSRVSALAAVSAHPQRGGLAAPGATSDGRTQKHRERAEQRPRAGLRPPRELSARRVRRAPRATRAAPHAKRAPRRRCAAEQGSGAREATSDEQRRQTPEKSGTRTRPRTHKERAHREDPRRAACATRTHGGGGRRARTGGQEEETTDAHQRPTSPCCSTAAVRTTRPLDPHAPAPAQRWCHPSRCALDDGSLRGATREEKTRHDEAADPRNTTRLFTTVKMCYLDDRPTSERHRADHAPRKRRAAPERAREHVFLPAAVRGRVARRKEEEGRSLHLPRDDGANECGGSGRRVSGRATSGRLDRSRTQNKHERTGSSGRSTSKSDSRRLGWKTFVWARRSDRVSWV